MSFSQEEIEEFKIEAIDLLNEAEQGLLNVEQGGAFKTAYDLVFRSFHSLKGAAGMLELTILQEHMHKVENLFQSLKDSESVDPQDISFFLTSVDGARTILNSSKEIVFEYTLPSQGAKPAAAKIATEAPSTTPATPAPVVEEKKDSRPLIYIIDDEQDLVDILGHVMKKYDLRWKGFTSPVEAIKNLEADSPSLVLTDLVMPKMTGLEVLKEVKAITPDLPVILLSANLSKDTLIQAVSLGIYGVIEKPFRETQTISQVNLAIQQYETWHLLNKTIDMILFQFKDLEDFLKSQGREEIANILKYDVQNLLLSKRKLKQAIVAANQK